MAKYTQPQTMFEVLRQSYDERYYAHIYGSMAYQLGMRYQRSYAPMGEFPDYPLLYPSRLPVGESRRILSNQALTMMKVCYMVPEIDFPDVDEDLTEQIRKGLVNAWWTNESDYDGSEWAYESHRTFTDGDGFGIGWTRIGTEDGQTTIQNHRVLDVIWDRHAWNPGRSRFIAWIHHMPVEEAVSIFGSKVKGEATIFGENDGGIENKMQRVKVVEYRDMGLDTANPTCSYFLNSLNGKVLHVGENDLECINGAHYSHIHVSGMERPIGRVDMQLGSQEFRNGLERLCKLILARGSGFDAGDPANIDPEDLARMLGGQVLPFIRVTAREGIPVAASIDRKQAQDIPAGIFNMMQYTDREMAGESGNSDADRANLSMDRRTLGENEMAQEGADIQTAWSRRQYAEYQRRLWHKVFKVAGKWHTEPVRVNINVQGKNADMVLNDPADPRTALSNWLEEPSRINVNEDAMIYQSGSMRQSQAMRVWEPFIGDQFTNQAELRKKLFSAAGVKNPETLIDPTGQGGLTPPPMGMDPTTGQPMQGPPVAA